MNREKSKKTDIKKPAPKPTSKAPEPQKVEKTTIAKTKGEKRKQIEEDLDDEDEAYIDEFKEGENEDMEVSFDINVPLPSKDIFGAELFLKNYLMGTEFNYVGFTEHILGSDEKPNDLTSIVKIPYEFTSKTEYEWNYDVYGVFSLVDLRKFAKLDFVKSIKKYLLDHATIKKEKTELEEYLDNDASGLIINERVVNLPMNIAPHLHRQLFEEIEEKQKKGDLSKFKYYILITKVYEDQSQKPEESGQSKKKVKMPLGFYKEEEECYFAESILSFFIPIKNTYSEDFVQVDMSKNLTYKRLVMIIPKKAIPGILKKITEEFDDSVME